MVKYISIIVFTFLILILFLVLAYKMVIRPADIKPEGSIYTQPTITGTFRIKDSKCTSYKIGEQQGINSIKDSILIVCNPPLFGIIVNLCQIILRSVFILRFL